MKISRREAISPVIATIIIIAVTIAISLAVAAWLMGLWSGFVGGPKITASLVNITADKSGSAIYAYVNFINTGSAADKVAPTAVTLRIGGNVTTCSTIDGVSTELTISPTPPDKPVIAKFVFKVSSTTAESAVGYTGTIEIRFTSGNTIILTGSIIKKPS